MSAAKKQTEADEPQSYEQAVSELEKILSSLDGNSVDVDALAAQVQRASLLISWCRDRIDAAQFEIDKITTDLGDDE